MVTRGVPFAYLNTVTGKAAADPIWIWHQYFGPQAALVFITRRAREGAFQRTLAELSTASCVRAVTSVLRVEGDE